MTDEKRKGVIDRLKRGDTLRDISDKEHVSLRDVLKVKKEAPEVMTALTEADLNKKIDALSKDYYISSSLKSQLQSMSSVEDVKKTLAKFEDSEEGWVYNLPQSVRRERSIWFMGIAYPESAPPDWKEKILAKGWDLAVSPLHDKDIWLHDSPAVIAPDGTIIREAGALYHAGERKKAHWHFIIKVDLLSPIVEMSAEVQMITHGPAIQKCRSLRNSFLYFTHKNAPEKYQGYDETEIYTSVNFHIEPNKWETAQMLQEITYRIQVKHITTIFTLLNDYKDMPEYFAIIAARTPYIDKCLTDMWRQEHPDGKVQRIVIERDNRKDNNYGSKEDDTND